MKLKDGKRRDNSNDLAENNANHGQTEKYSSDEQNTGKEGINFCSRFYSYALLIIF